MKIHVVKDKSGKMLATFQSASGNGAAQAKPVSNKGYEVQQVEVPENYRSNPGTIYK